MLLLLSCTRLDFYDLHHLAGGTASLGANDDTSTTFYGFEGNGGLWGRVLELLRGCEALEGKGQGWSARSQMFESPFLPPYYFYILPSIPL